MQFYGIKGQDKFDGWCQAPSSYGGRSSQFWDPEHMVGLATVSSHKITYVGLAHKSEVAVATLNNLFFRLNIKA